MNDIQKLSVYDARIVQNQAKYAVDKGALSNTSTSFTAISQTASQFTFNVTVPSQNVFLDRAIDWEAECYLSMDVLVAGTPAGTEVGTPVVVFGRDVALAPFPLHQLVSTMQASINDTSVVLNTQDVLNVLLRLTDYKKNRMVRTCPTMLDKFQNYSDANGAIGSPIASYVDAVDYDNVPNGAYYDVEFTTPCPPTTADLNKTYTVDFKFKSTEKLVLSPFIFAGSHEQETGLFGLNSVQFVFNIGSSLLSRVVRNNPSGAALNGRTISNVRFQTVPFRNSKITCTFLTPSLDLKLPERSVVNYMEFPRYITNSLANITAGQKELEVQSNNIVLPMIPDMLIVYARGMQKAGSGPYAGTIGGPTVGDYFLPIEKITINFDNYSGLLSSHTKQQLYAMSVHNGLEMDYNTWSGFGKSSTAAGNIPLVGGPLLLKFGNDIALQASQAPGLLGNFNLQYNVKVSNQTSSDLDVVLYTIAVNSGFFETVAGSSRIVRGVTEAEVISAPMIEDSSREGLSRVVGGGFFGRLGNILSKAKDVYGMVKPGSDIGKAISGVKGALPEGMVKEVLGKVGYGRSAGSRSAGGKKSLEERLI
jgi:hypothetical protein